MAHLFQKHRESQREAGHERYRKSGGKATKSKHVSKHIHITVNKGDSGLAGGTPLGPMPAGAGPLPGGPTGGPMPAPPPGGMPPPPGAMPPPGMPPMKRGGKT